MKKIMLLILLLFMIGCSPGKNAIESDIESKTEINFNYENLLNLETKFHITKISSEMNDFQIEITPKEIWDIDPNTGEQLVELDKDEIFEAGIIVQGEMTRNKVLDGTTIEKVMSQKMSVLEDYSDMSHDLCSFKKDIMGDNQVIRATCEDSKNILFITVVGNNINKDKEIMNEIISVMTS